jgi:iron complex outermembrane receptor protein
VLVYGSVSRGVKAGSYNAPLLGSYLGSGGDASLPYKPEELMAYEVGFKSSLSDRTRLNGAAYYYDYKDSQAFLFVGVGGVVINADAESTGAELSLQTTPVDGLDLSVGIAWIDATTKDVPLRAGSPLPPRDVKPTYTPEWQASAMARYAWAALGGQMNVRADASYSDDYFYNLRNFSADKYDSYVLVNLGIGWTSEDDLWQVSLDARNVTR